MDVVIHIICVLYILLQYQLLCSGPGYVVLHAVSTNTHNRHGTGVQGKPAFSDGVERSH